MFKITKDVKEANLITHSGKFHADDVFATAFLTWIIDNPVVCRINNVPDDIGSDVIVYDVGFGKFDHHQKEFDLRHENGVKYASFGLLYKEFGLEYLKSIYPNYTNYAEIVFSMVEHDIVESIDAIDNGEFPDVNTSYNYKSLDSIIGDFNVSWNEDVDNDIYFLNAVDVASVILSSSIKKCFAKALAKEKVDLAIENSSNHVMLLDEYMPFKDFVLSSNNPKALDILFCITPSNRGGYCVHTIPVSKGTYVTRLDFPKSWGGLVDLELQEVSGIKSASFCHSSLFLAVCGTLDDAYLMTKLAIDEKKNLQ